MSARVVSEVEQSGQLVARKRSRDAADAARLTHEADVLAAARHPGVVEVVRLAHDDTGTALVTAFVGTHSLETVGRLGIERAAGVVAALAETVADLHDLGIVHGRIDPSHVLIGAGGRPVLCGFAGGGPVGSMPPPGGAASFGFEDPAADDVLTTERDVHALGCLLRALVIDEGTDLEPIPDRRVARLRVPWSGYQRRALLTLADRATDEAPLRRPPARRLAADIHDTVPGAHLDDDPFVRLRSTADDAPQTRKARRPMAAMVAIGFVVIFIGVAAVRRGGPVAANTEPDSRSAPDVRVHDTTSTTRVSVGGTVGVAGDGAITIGSQRFSIGEPGDKVATGDWNCDGTATIALLRPSSGSVFVFDEWASEGHDASVSPTTVIPGAVDLRTRTAVDGCSTLSVVTSDGSEREVWG